MIRYESLRELLSAMTSLRKFTYEHSKKWEDAFQSNYEVSVESREEQHSIFMPYQIITALKNYAASTLVHLDLTRYCPVWVEDLEIGGFIGG